MTNILTNPSFTANITGWSGSQSAQAWQSTGGRDDPGCLKMTANGTGTRTFSSGFFSATAGQAYSAGAWLKWLTGATPRAMAVDIQWGTGNAVTTTVSGTTITPNTSSYTQASILNQVCPSGSDQMRVRVRMVGAVATDEALVDDAQLNTGSVLDGSGPTVKVWNGTAEVACTVSVWNGTSEVAATLDFD